MEADPMMPTGRLEEAGQAVELLRGELRCTLALALLPAGSRGGYERVSPRSWVTASLPHRVKVQRDPGLQQPPAQREGGGAGGLPLASSPGWGARRLGCLPAQAPGSYLTFLFPHLYNRVNKHALPHSDDIKLSSFMLGATMRSTIETHK